MGLNGRSPGLRPPLTTAERQRRFRMRRQADAVAWRTRETPRVYHRAQRTDWGTPEDVFAPWHARFGFTLDVCALPRNTKCPRFFSPQDNGLHQDWGTHICWMNPPFGRGIAQWIAKAVTSAQHGATVVCLVKSSTDAQWWHQAQSAATEVHFLEKRVRFVGAQDRMPFPCCVFVFSPRPPVSTSPVLPCR